MGGTQKGFALDSNYQKVFGPLYVQKSYVKKFKDILPDIPDIDISLDNLSCKAAIAALQSLTNFAEDALKVPNELMNMAKDIISKPFGAAEEILDAALHTINDMEAAIMSLLEGPGNVIDNFKKALEKLLDCPFIADTPIGKEAAMLLDMVNAGAGLAAIRSMIYGFQAQLRAAAMEQLNAVKNIPLSKIDDLQKMLNEAIKDAGIPDALDMMDKITKCVEALCAAGTAAVEGVKGVKDFLESLNGATWDKVTGVITAPVVNAADEVQKKALDLANQLAMAKLKLSVS